MSGGRAQNKQQQKPTPITELRDLKSSSKSQPITELLDLKSSSKSQPGNEVVDPVSAGANRTPFPPPGVRHPLTPHRIRASLTPTPRPPQRIMWRVRDQRVSSKMWMRMCPMKAMRSPMEVLRIWSGGFSRDQ